ncbi:HIV Tat-specific factor 1 -like protein [Sarcoptes scabiei]|uniref:17S U2 SnRNP complex component HTATSF1 n=1 Tax=Sarcoptes scabiei TaxID=52283 RepID=A0A834R425_SARSC|nr:HIV Tat-specific factor 1 -like protein [Sarcoptes scabiei]
MEKNIDAGYDDDFEFQLRQEALEAQRKESNTDVTTSNYSIDGTQYEWDAQKKAWFPKINDDFIAVYLSQYGQFDQTSVDNKFDAITNVISSETRNEDPEKIVEIDQSDSKNESNIDKEPQSSAQTLNRKRKNEQQPPQWFEIEEKHNTNVYVSNLPMDITEDEFITLMKKCGLIMKDDRGQLKIKLYLDECGMPKGDGRCCYIKTESVELALKILDGYFYRDHFIKVERAKFSLKGEYDPSKKPKKKKTNRKDKEKQKKKMDKLFDWRPDKIPGERSKNEKVVVIKNMFDVKIFEKDPKLILEYKSDLQEECEEKCGPVKKVEIFDLHPEGVAMVTFKEFDDADKCVQLMNGRFFAGRKLDSHLWDGKTKYKVQETEEEIEERMKKWDQYLEQQDLEQQK